MNSLSCHRAMPERTASLSARRERKKDVHRRRANQAPDPDAAALAVGQSHFVYSAGVLSSAHRVRMRRKGARNASKGSAASAGCSAKPPIEAQVIACHHVRGEPLLERLARSTWKCRRSNSCRRK
jgi:hypothetical protein